MSRSKKGGSARITSCNPYSCEMEVTGNRATQAARELVQIVRGNVSFVPRIVIDRGDRITLRVPNDRRVKQKFQRVIQASA